MLAFRGSELFEGIRDPIILECREAPLKGVCLHRYLIRGPAGRTGEQAVGMGR